MNLYRGKVTRVTNAGVFVEIKSTWPGVEWGPLKRVAYETTTRAAHSHTLGSAGEPAHTHSVTSTNQHSHTANVITPGQTVLVAEVKRDDLVILGPLV
jgi:hypothetical protein